LPSRLILLRIREVGKRTLSMILVRHLAYERARAFRAVVLPPLLFLAVLAWLLMRTFAWVTFEVVTVIVVGLASAVVIRELRARYRLMRQLSDVPHISRFG
jgi:membrane protein CcdC involved in cytochrome C biogenesis